MILFPLNILRVEWKNPRKKFEKIRNFTVEISQSCDHWSGIMSGLIRMSKTRKGKAFIVDKNFFQYAITAILPLSLTDSTTSSAPTRTATHASRKRSLTICLSTNIKTNVFKESETKCLLATLATDRDMYVDHGQARNLVHETATKN